MKSEEDSRLPFLKPWLNSQFK